MTRGDRVKLQDGRLGTVNYVINDTPKFYKRSWYAGSTTAKPFRVSVILDDCRDKPGYIGSVFLAEKVEVIHE